MVKYIDTSDASPLYSRHYRVSPLQLGIIENKVAIMLEKSVIQPSVSPWSSPAVLVRKRDGSCDFAWIISD